jgi:hypothetical protein
MSCTMARFPESTMTVKIAGDRSTVLVVTATKDTTLGQRRKLDTPTA